MPERPLHMTYVLSYRAPWYVRTASLLDGLRALPAVTVTEATNRTEGPHRYVETLTALRQVPPSATDAYLVGFRGHEIMPAVRRWAKDRPVVLDCLVSPSAALSHDGKRGRTGRLVGRVLEPFERRILHAADAVLVDTQGHAEFLCSQFGLPPDSVHAVPIGAVPAPRRQVAEEGRPLRVLFYGSFLPLHGIDVIADALGQVAGTDLDILIVGASRRDLDRWGFPMVSHARWMRFADLVAEVIPATDLVLGGPFGPTDQASRVITGKTVQALAAGVPTVVGLSDETERHGFVDRQNCLAVPRGDAHRLAEAIRWARDHRPDLERIGAGGRALFDSRFSTAALAHAIDPVVRTLR